MMGVYIKGVEMPKDGEHPYWVTIHSDGTVEYNENKGQGWQTSEAVPVPPHGRLIDAEELFPLYADLLDGRDVQPVIPKIVIDTAPTIIPAEEAPAKDKNVPTYDLLYEEGGPDA